MYRNSPILGQYNPRDVWFGSKLAPIGSKWDKSETFTDFSAFSLGDLKYTEKNIIKSIFLVHFLPWHLLNSDLKKY